MVLVATFVVRCFGLALARLTVELQKCIDADAKLRRDREWGRATGLLVCRRRHTEDRTFTHVIASGPATDQFRLIHSYLDANNYYYAQLMMPSASPGTLKLFKRVAGVDTELGSTSVSGSFTKTFTACFDAEKLRFSASASDAPPGSRSTLAVTLGSGDPINNTGAVALGMGTAGGTGTFEDFHFEKVSDKCQACGRGVGACQVCPETPSQWLIELDGMSSGSPGACEGDELCSDLNRAYLVSLICGNDCCWSMDWAGLCDDTNSSPPSQIRLFDNVTLCVAGVPNGVQLNVEINHTSCMINQPGLGYSLRWRKVFPLPFDCMALADEVIPSLSSGYCSIFGSTLRVTAIA